VLVFVERFSGGRPLDEFVGRIDLVVERAAIARGLDSRARSPRRATSLGSSATPRC
jgi:hypothetical protein